MMSIPDDKIETFEQTLVLPALREVCAARRLTTDYEATLITSRPAAKPEVEQLLSELVAAVGPEWRPGPSLALENHERRAGMHDLGGRYVMTVFYMVHGDTVFATPAVVFWMKFNGKLHVFIHRYDNTVPLLPVESVTRPQILNHILNSFDFYKLEAFSEQPFPGYR